MTRLRGNLPPVVSAVSQLITHLIPELGTSPHVPDQWS